MKTHPATQRGILLMECLVYISVLSLLLGVGTMAFWRCWDHSRALRRNADDIVLALEAGERWRADVRQAGGPILLENTNGVEQLHIPGRAGEITYTLAAGKLHRQGPGRMNTLLLTRVQSSRMQPDARQHVIGWRWNLEMQKPRRNLGLRPLFTFEAVPPAAAFSK